MYIVFGVHGTFRQILYRKHSIYAKRCRAIQRKSNKRSNQTSYLTSFGNYIYREHSNRMIRCSYWILWLRTHNYSLCIIPMNVQKKQCSIYRICIQLSAMDECMQNIDWPTYIHTRECAYNTNFVDVQFRWVCVGAGQKGNVWLLKACSYEIENYWKFHKNSFN